MEYKIKHFWGPFSRRLTLADLFLDLTPHTSHLTQTVRLFSNSRNDLMFLMTLGTQRQLGVSKFFF